LVLDTLLGQPGAAPPARKKRAQASAEKTSGEPITVEVAPLGAPTGADLAALRKRYRSVLKARPFRARSFDPPKKGAPPSEDPEPEEGETAEPTPGTVTLWLTGVVGSGAARRAILEHRATGKGLFASAGLKVGGRKILRVDALAVVLGPPPKGEKPKAKPKELTLKLGESLELPLSASDQLRELTPSEAGKVVVKSSYKPKVELTETKRLTILERLKARRKAALKRAREAAKKTGAKQ